MGIDGGGCIQLLFIGPQLLYLFPSTCESTAEAGKLLPILLMLLFPHNKDEGAIMINSLCARPRHSVFKQTVSHILLAADL